MQMRPEIQLSTMITAMTDVILPAVDPANKLAVEQSHLVIGMLHLMARQLPLQFGFDRDELQRLVDAAGEILTGVPAVGSAAQTLDEHHRRGQAVLQASQAGPADLLESIRALRRDLGALMGSFHGRPEDAAPLAAVERIVMKLSNAQLLRDRALLKSQNWETDADAVPEIETLLG